MSHWTDALDAVRAARTKSKADLAAVKAERDKALADLAACRASLPTSPPAFPPVVVPPVTPPTPPTPPVVPPVTPPVVTPAGRPLTWAPPAGWEKYTPKTIPAAGGTITLASATDYRLIAPEPITGPVTIVGGRNIVWIGGQIDGGHTPPVASGGPPQGGYDSQRRGIRISDGDDVPRTIHLEGIRGLPGTYYGDFLQCAIRSNNSVRLVVQNIRNDGWTWGSKDTNHADAFQLWGGPRTLLVDGFTALHCTYQGFYWDPADGRSFPSGAGADWEVRNVNLVGAVGPAGGAKYLLANRRPANTRITCANVYTSGQGYDATDSFGQWPFVGLFQSAVPGSGDFVPASLWATGSYISPGYVEA